MSRSVSGARKRARSMTGRAAGWALGVPSRQQRGDQQFEDHLNPADTFPFACAETVDHLTGARDAIMKRASDPKVLHTQTSTEYWQRRGIARAHHDRRSGPGFSGEGARLPLVVEPARRGSHIGVTDEGDLQPPPERPRHVGPVPCRTGRARRLIERGRGAAPERSADRRRRHPDGRGRMVAAVPRRTVGPSAPRAQRAVLRGSPGRTAGARPCALVRGAGSGRRLRRQRSGRRTRSHGGRSSRNLHRVLCRAAVEVVPVRRVAYGRSPDRR